MEQPVYISDWNEEANDTDISGDTGEQANLTVKIKAVVETAWMLAELDNSIQDNTGSGVDLIRLRAELVKSLLAQTLLLESITN